MEPDDAGSPPTPIKPAPVKAEPEVSGALAAPVSPSMAEPSEAEADGVGAIAPPDPLIAKFASDPICSWEAESDNAGALAARATEVADSAPEAAVASPPENPKAAAVLKAIGGAFAVRQDRPELITRFIDVGGEVDARLPISALVPASKITEAGDQLCPLVHLAALAGLSNTFRELLSKGVDTSWRDNVGWTLLHACASGGSVVSTQLCLESAVKEVDIGDSDNDTPLHVAAFAGRDEVAKLLLSHGADTTRTDGDSCTPLHCACRSGIWSLVSRLLDARADPGAVDAHGGTPMAYAVLSHAEGLEDTGLSLLRKAGARVSESATTVATRQLTSKPACARCIAVDKELRRLREEDVCEDAEKAAADAAAVLLEEEQMRFLDVGQKKLETKQSKDKRSSTTSSTTSTKNKKTETKTSKSTNAKQSKATGPKAEALLQPQHQDSIPMVSEESGHHPKSKQRDANPAAERDVTDESTKAKHNRKQAMQHSDHMESNPMAAVCKGKGSNTFTELSEPVDPAVKTNDSKPTVDGSESVAPILDDMMVLDDFDGDSQMLKDSQSEPCEPSPSMTPTTVGAVASTMRVRTLWADEPVVDGPLISSAELAAYAIDVRATKSETSKQGKSSAKPGKLSAACRRANLLDDESVPAQRAEKRKQKRARHRENKVAGQTREVVLAEESLHDGSSPSLRADAPEFCPRGIFPELADMQPCADYSRLLPPYVDSIAWSFDPLMEDVNDIHMGCYYVVDPGCSGDFDASDLLALKARESMWESNSDDGGSTRSSCTTDPDLCLARILLHTVVFRVLQKSAPASDAIAEAGEVLAMDGEVSPVPYLSPMLTCFDSSVKGFVRSETGEVLATDGVPSAGFYPHSSFGLLAYDSALSGDQQALSTLPSLPPGAGKSDVWRSSTPELFFEWESQRSDSSPSGIVHVESASAVLPPGSCPRRSGRFELLVDRDGHESLLALPR